MKFFRMYDKNILTNKILTVFIGFAACFYQ